MCGGTQAVFDACRPVFATFGKLIVLAGPTGAGQRAKIINNSLLAANIALAHAALSAGETLGLDRDTLAGLIRGSSGFSLGLEVSARFASPAAFAGAWLLVKDVGLLQSILPGHAGADALHRAADPYLTEATQGAAGAQTAKL
jgi:3-hydroxyisobutyrate dehydrogenase-like beta-hydroxyacid dehydrogenase